MTLGRIRSIYEFSKCLWGGHLASLASANSPLSHDHFCNIFDDAITGIVRSCFVIARKIAFIFERKKLASQYHSFIGIEFSFSTTIVCCDAQMMAFCGLQPTISK